jgi:hypothetical protein
MTAIRLYILDFTTLVESIDGISSRFMKDRRAAPNSARRGAAKAGLGEGHERTRQPQRVKASRISAIGNGADPMPLDATTD